MRTLVYNDITIILNDYYIVVIKDDEPPLVFRTIFSINILEVVEKAKSVWKDKSFEVIDI